MQHKRKCLGSIFFVLKSYLFVMTATFKSERKKIVKMMHEDFWLLFKRNVEGDNRVRRSFTQEFGNANQLRWFLHKKVQLKYFWLIYDMLQSKIDLTDGIEYI